MLLGKLPVPGRPTILNTVGQGPNALAVGAGGGCLDIFTLIYPFSPLSPSLWEAARYRLKYCLKGPLNQKQPTKSFLSPSLWETARYRLKYCLNGPFIPKQPTNQTGTVSLPSAIAPPDQPPTHVRKQVLSGHTGPILIFKVHSRGIWGKRSSHLGRFAPLRRFPPCAKICSP